jgi:hypothetical protein
LGSLLQLLCGHAIRNSAYSRDRSNVLIAHIHHYSIQADVHFDLSHESAVAVEVRWDRMLGTDGNHHHLYSDDAAAVPAY